MSSIPSNIARVPNLLVSQTLRRNISAANIGLLQLQTQLSSGKRLNNLSDDPIDSSLVAALNDRLRASDQRLRNFEHADASLATVDSTLGDVNELLLEARTIASSQIG
ncbi:MAG: hypothetical protein VYC34_08925, partial [Planctomycetota bacterium]|nr:hypothetical protein [Planctomycetota bacterium]